MFHRLKKQDIYRDAIVLHYMLVKLSPKQSQPPTPGTRWYSSCFLRRKLMITGLREPDSPQLSATQWVLSKCFPGNNHFLWTPLKSRAFGVIASAVSRCQKETAQALQTSRKSKTCRWGGKWSNCRRQPYWASLLILIIELPSKQWVVLQSPQ